VKLLLKKIPIVLILCLTFVLMVFVGYGESRRTYYRFRIETAILQSDTFLDIVAPFIDAGFPLTMYSGYEGISQVFLESNEDIQIFAVVNSNEEIIFEKNRSVQLDNNSFKPAKIRIKDSDDISLFESDDMFRLERNLPAEKDGRSGRVVFYLSKEVSHVFLIESYQIVFYFLIGACLFITLAFYIATSKRITKTRKSNKARDSFIKLFYLIIFIILGIVVTLTTIQIYSAGVRGKADAIGTLLARRLYPVSDLGLDYQDLKGVDTILIDFKKRYDIVDSVSLITSEIRSPDDKNSQQGYILYDSNPSQIGLVFNPDLSRHLIFDATLYESVQNGFIQRLLIKISVPRKEINQAVMNSFINFSALLIGCALIAMIFLNVGLAIATSLGQGTDSLSSFESLQLIKAAYFLVVFISAMAVPFLPLLVSELNNGSVSSLPFMIYYLAFAAVLIPSGNMAAKGKIKKTMALGFIAELIGGLLVAFSSSLPLLTLGRAMCGVGQGFFLIGFQSYVISVTPPEKRTQGAAIKVIARNSALIAGTAIGALLYVFMGYRNLFILSAAISILGFLYLLLMVPQTEQKFSSNTKKLELKNISFVLKDSGFLKVLLLTGIPAKMGITGVVNFAVPLLMGSMGFTPEAIGRFLMLFFIVSMITTKIASKQADKSGNTKGALFFSSMIGGIGMLLMGFQTLVLGQNYNVITIAGLMMIGISNGLISAPIITQITKTRASDKVGHSPMIAIYIFLERFGHILGPGILSALIVFSGNETAIGIGLFGSASLFLGLLFFIITRKKDFSDASFKKVERTAKSTKAGVDYEETVEAAGKVFSLGIQFGDIITGDSPAEVEELAKKYHQSMKYLRSRVSLRENDVMRTEGGNVLVHWPANKNDGLNAFCRKALMIKKENQIPRDNTSLTIKGMGLHMHRLILTGIESQHEPVNLHPLHGFSQVLASLNDVYGSDIIVSEDVQKIVADSFQTRILDIINIPGTEEYIEIYELIAPVSEPASEQKIENSIIYEQGFRYYLDKNFAKAQELIGNLMEKTPYDKSVRQLYRRIVLVMNMPELVNDNWKGIIN